MTHCVVSGEPPVIRGNGTWRRRGPHRNDGRAAGGVEIYRCLIGVRAGLDRPALHAALREQSCRNQNENGTQKQHSSANMQGHAFSNPHPSSKSLGPNLLRGMIVVRGPYEYKNLMKFHKPEEPSPPGRARSLLFFKEYLKQRLWMDSNLSVRLRHYLPTAVKHFEGK